MIPTAKSINISTTLPNPPTNNGYIVFDSTSTLILDQITLHYNCTVAFWFYQTTNKFLERFYGWQRE